MPGTSVRRSGAGLDDLEGVHPEGSDDALGHGRPNAAHLARGQVLLDALGPGRRGGLQNFGLELEPMRAVADPDAACGDPLPGRNSRRMANDCHKVTLAARVDFQDREAVLGIVESDALDRTRERLEDWPLINL